MDEIKEQKPSNTNLYIVFVLILIVVGGGAYWYGKHSVKPGTPTQFQMNGQGQRPGGPPNMKGHKLSDTNFANQAVQIYPGDLSDSAKSTMSGWDLKTSSLQDGSTQVSLIPTGSEAVEGDSAHTFDVKSGDKLYFVDINPNDDNSKEDGSARDDIGILTDSNGIIQ